MTTDDIGECLRQVAKDLRPLAREQRLGLSTDRDWTTGLCWSFAEGVRLWLAELGEKSSIAALCEEDLEELRDHASHVVVRTADGTLLDAEGAWSERGLLLHWAETFELTGRGWAPQAGARWSEALELEGGGGIWIDYGLGDLKLRSYGIYRPRQVLVDAVLAALLERCGN